MREPDVTATLAIYRRREPEVAANQTSRRTRSRQPDVAALFLTFAKRMGKITPRTRANIREKKKYASYPDGGSDYTNCMAPSGRKEDSRNSQEVDNQVYQRGRERKVPPKTQQDEKQRADVMCRGVRRAKSKFLSHASVAA